MLLINHAVNISHYFNRAYIDGVRVHRCFATSTCTGDIHLAFSSHIFIVHGPAIEMAWILMDLHIIDEMSWYAG